MTSDKLDLSTGFSLPFVGKDPEFKVVEAPTYDERWPVDRRAEAVREAFLHAYRSYEKYAMPMDELRPITNGSMQMYANSFYLKSLELTDILSLNGWGLTVYDSLDTLWLMDLKGEFNRATKHISKIKFRQSGVRLNIFTQLTSFDLVNTGCSSHVLRDRHSVPRWFALGIRSFPSANFPRQS